MSKGLEPIEHLTRRAVGGERDALGGLYTRLGGDVLRFLVGLRMPLDHQQLEDVVQETFLRLFEALARFDPSRPLKPFVLGIARRVALEAGRQRVVARSIPPEPIPPNDPADPVLWAALQTERQELLLEGLGTLDVEQRAALVLRFVNGLTMAELAQALACSVPTARARLRAAGHLLRLDLGRRGLVSRVDLSPAVDGEDPA